MKIALVTTTVNIPHVLRLYRALDSTVRMFIATDKKSPVGDIDALCLDLGNAEWSMAGREIDYACSEPIGWACVQRRNIATLEATRWGADVIVTIDDDNIPLSPKYFSDFTAVLRKPYNGTMLSSTQGWIDPGFLNGPPVRHRGFPDTLYTDFRVGAQLNARVGVAAGLCLGDPDVGAAFRMTSHPTCWGTNGVLAAYGTTIAPDIKTVFNSQNTAFVRALAPAMFMLPGVGRYDDIFASLICQRVMRDHGYVTHFGPPFVWQQRNAHNLIADLKSEVFGMEHIVEFAEWLDGLDLSTTSVLDAVRGIFTLMSALDWMPAQAREAGLAWCSDVERVL